MASKLVKRAVLGAGAIAAVVLLLLAVVHLPFARTRVLDRIRDYAARDLGLLVDASSISYNLLAGSAELRNVSVTASRGEPVLLQVDRLRIALKPGLLRGHVEIDRLELTRPRLVLVRHPDGTMNLPASKKEPSGPSTPLRLGLVDIRQLTLALQDEATGRSATLGPVDLALDTMGSNTPAGRFGPAPFAIRFDLAGGPSRSLTGTLAGRLGFDGARLTATPLRADTPEGRLELDGWVDVIAEKPRLDVRGRLEVDLAGAERLAGASRSSLGGHVRATLTASGPMLEPSAVVKVEGSELRYGSLRGMRTNGEAGVTGSRVTLRTLAITSDEGRVDASGVIDLSDERARDTHLTAQWQGIDVDRVLDSADVRLPVRLKTMTRGRVRVRGDPTRLGERDAGWLDSVAVDAHTELTGYETPGLDGQADLAIKDGAWTLKHDLASSAARASVRGTLAGRVAPELLASTLTGRTRFRIENLADAAASLDAAGIAIPPVLKSISGVLSGDVDLHRHVRTPDGHSRDSGARSANPRPSGYRRRRKAQRRPQRTSHRLSRSARGGSATRRVRRILVGRTHRGEIQCTRRRPGPNRSGFQSALRVRSRNVRHIPAAQPASRPAPQSAESQPPSRPATSPLAAQSPSRPVAQSPGFELSGSIQVEGTARGTIESPQVDATLAARQVAVDQAEVGDVTATVNLAGTRLTVDARAPAVGVRTRADTTTTAPYAYEAVAHLEQTPLARLVPAATRETIRIGDGTINGSLSARGTLDRPLESTAEIALRNVDLRIADTPLTLEQPATLSLGSDRLAVTPLFVRIGSDTHARVSGVLSRGAISDPLTLTLHGPLSDLLALGAPYLPAGPLNADGRLQLDLRVSGTLETPDPSGTIAIRAASVQYGDLPPLTGVSLDGRIEPTRLTLQGLEAAWQQAALRAEGALPWRLIAPIPPSTSRGEGFASWGQGWLASLGATKEPATVKARVTGITPAVIAPFVSASRLQEVDGTVVATASVEADALALDSVRGGVVLEQASLRLAGVPFSQLAPTRVTLARGRASIDEFRWSAQGNELRATGSVSLLGPAPTLDLGLSGTMDLRMLGAFAESVAAGGVARTDLQIAGTLERPTVVGRLAIADGELRLEAPALMASDLVGDVWIDPRQVATLSLTGLINGGDAKLTGNVDLAQPASPSGRVTLTARNVAVEYPKGLFTESNADLSLVLGSARSSLTGKVTVLGGTYREPIALAGGLFAGLSHEALATTAEGPSLLETLDLDVAVVTEEAIRVDNNYGRLDLTANLQISGTPDQPGALGRVQAGQDGEIYLAGNVYRIQRLTVDLTNPRAVVPVVNFLAETRVGNAAIEIELECDDAGPCRRDIRIPDHRRHRRAGRGHAARPLRGRLRRRRPARPPPLRRGLRPGLANRGPRHAEARAGSIGHGRHLRRPDAGGRRRGSRVAPHARQASRRKRRARLLAEPRAGGVHMEHDVPCAVWHVVPGTAAGRSEPNRTNSGTSRSSAAARVPVARRGPVHGSRKSALPVTWASTSAT